MATNEKEYDVFISYSHEDKIIAEGICGYLESKKIRCWIDYRNLPKGRSHSKLIPSAIRQSGLLLAVFSKDFNSSDDTDNEITIASNRNIPILVFRITDDDFDGTKEYYLTKSNWIEAFPEPEKCFGELYNNICLLLGIQSDSMFPKIEISADILQSKENDELVKKGLVELRKTDGDKGMAAYYIRKAAKNGYPEAEYLLGRIYSEGRGLPHDWKKAILWLTTAANHGHAKAMFYLGRFHHYGINVERNTMRALELYSKSADLGYGRAMKELGRIFHTGELGTTDDKRSTDYYEKAFEVLYESAMGDNDGECQQILGNSYLDGEGVTKSYHQAVMLYRRSAANCDANGYNSLAYCYGSGLGLKKDEAKSHELSLEAAKLGLPIAMDNVAKDYFNGKGVEKSVEDYHEWVYRAAECGCHTALFDIGIDYAVGEVCKKNLTKSEKWLKEAINSGSLQAMLWLGSFYENGDIDIPNGKQKAFELYKQAAINGFFSAYINLANCYFHGIGTGENDVEAERWYLKVVAEYEKMLEAEETFISEQTGAGSSHLVMIENIKDSIVSVFKNLVWIYRNSSKVEHDAEKARKYEQMAFDLAPDDKQLESNIASADNVNKIEEAAKNGEPDALDELLTIYANDEVQIEKWATYAMANKIFVTQRDYARGIDHIDMVLRKAKVDDRAIYINYLEQYFDYARSSGKLNNCYALFNAVCEEYKRGSLNLNDEELEFLRQDAKILIDDVFCAGYLRKRKSHFDILFPGYAPQRIIDGDFSNDRDFKLFYAENTTHKGDDIVTDYAIKDIFKPMKDDISYQEVIASENGIVVQAGDFITAIRDFNHSYNEVCRNNHNIQRQHIDDFSFEMMVPIFSPIQMQKYGMQALKALISCKSLWGQQWDTILSNSANLDRVLDVAEQTKDQNLQLFLIEYVELQLELDNFFTYTERLQTMVLDNNRQAIANELNDYVHRLDNESIVHHLPEFTPDNLPEGLFVDDNSEDKTFDSKDITDPEEQNQTGEDYYYGQNGKEQDYTKAVRWYRKSADQGYQFAQYNLGFCYEKGLGVSAQLVEASKWYRKAAEQGHAASQCSLGLCYEFGKGVTKDLEEAVIWYRKAAEQGYATAQCNLAYCYKNGIGLAQDETEAYAWFKKAAEQGHARAQDLLGDCYFYGLGVEKDFSEAVRWFTKSAEQEYSPGQYSLAWCYEKGCGIVANLEKAKEFYEKAAAKGHKGAQKELDRINGATE